MLLNLVETGFPAGTSASQGCKITVLSHTEHRRWLLLKTTLKRTLPRLPLLTPQHLLLGAGSQEGAPAETSMVPLDLEGGLQDAS